MIDVVINKEDVTALCETLKEIVKISPVTCAILVHKEGSILATSDTCPCFEHDTISAVAASFSGAVESIQNLAGKSETSILINHSVIGYMRLSLHCENAILILFCTKIRPMLKTDPYPRPLLMHLESIIKKISSQKPHKIIASGSDIRNKMDEIFGT